tara:strand:+ start:36091 stop:36525 length:435 start_codon:yes stop_codon:yes gene_type:complete
METTRILIFILSLLYFTSCNVINFGEGDLKTDLELEQKEISNIQDIEAFFEVRNGTDETKEYGFSSGCQTSFLISENGSKVFKSEENIFCTAALTSFRLKKNESKTFKLLNYFDIDLEPGSYTIKAYLIGYEDKVFAQQSFTVE